MASRARKRKQRAKRRGAAVATDPGQATADQATEASTEASASAKSKPERAGDRSAKDGARQRSRRRLEPEAPPPAPWGSFPLVELGVVAGLIVLVIGFFFAEGDTQAILIIAGLLLCSIAGLEIAVREHVAGYRSHTLVLAALPAVSVLAALFYLAPSSFPPVARLAVGAAIFGLAAWGLTRMFSARSGGHAFRVKKPARRG